MQHIHEVNITRDTKHPTSLPPSIPSPPPSLPPAGPDMTGIRLGVKTKKQQTRLLIEPDGWTDGGLGHTHRGRRAPAVITPVASWLASSPIHHRHIISIMIANIVGSSDMPLAAAHAGNGRTDGNAWAAALPLLLLLTCSCFLRRCRVGRVDGERGCNTSFSMLSC